MITTRELLVRAREALEYDLDHDHGLLLADISSHLSQERIPVEVLAELRAIKARLATIEAGVAVVRPEVPYAEYSEWVCNRERERS